MGFDSLRDLFASIWNFLGYLLTGAADYRDLSWTDFTDASYLVSDSSIFELCLMFFTFLFGFLLIFLFVKIFIGFIRCLIQ